MEGFISSKQIAEKTNKNHANVMRDIREMCEQANVTICKSISNQICFEIDNQEVTVLENQYIIDAGHTKRVTTEYLLNAMAAEVLSLGYDVKRRIAMVQLINALRDALQVKKQLPDFDNPIEAARAWADEREGKLLAVAQIKEKEQKIDLQNKQLKVAVDKNSKNELTIERNKPRVRLAEALENSDQNESWSHLSNILAQYLRKKLGVKYKIGRNTLLEWARNQGFLTKKCTVIRKFDKNKDKWIEYNKYENAPINKHVQAGLFWVSKTPRRNDPEKIDSTTMITPKGFKKLFNDYIDWYNKINGTSFELFPDY